MSDRTAAEACPECGAINCATVLATLSGYVLDDKRLYESSHELVLDAYRAQHSLSGTPLTTFFGLNGLLLMLEFDHSGPQARDAHKRIADRSREWPVFRKRLHVPTTVATVTASMTSSPAVAERSIREWAELVWAAWSDERDQIKTETELRLGRSL